jgi:hypothetical protein
MDTKGFIMVTLAVVAGSVLYHLFVHKHVRKVHENYDSEDADTNDSDID